MEHESPKQYRARLERIARRMHEVGSTMFSDGNASCDEEDVVMRDLMIRMAKAADDQIKEDAEALVVN